MKKCPFCADPIEEVAMLCSHCGKFVAVSLPAPPFTILTVDTFVKEPDQAN